MSRIFQSYQLRAFVSTISTSRPYDLTCFCTSKKLLQEPNEVNYGERCCESVFLQERIEVNASDTPKTHHECYCYTPHTPHPTPGQTPPSTWVYPADYFSLRKLRLAASFRQGSEMCKHDPSAKWRGMPAKADCPLWMDPLEMGKCSILTGLAAVDWMLPLTCMSNHVKVEIGSIENTPCQHALIVLRIEPMASVQMRWDLCWTASWSDWTGSPATPRRLHHHAKTSESKANEMLTNLSWTATISNHGSSAHIKSSTLLESH